MRCDSLFIALYQPETDRVRFVYSLDEGVVDDSQGDERSLDAAPLSRRIIRERQTIQIDDLDLDRPQLQSALIAFGQTEKRSRSWLGVPMISGNEVQGVLAVQSYQPAAFSSADADLLMLLASQVSVAVENARLIQQLRRTIVELSAPLISVAAGVLVLPLVGTIDAERGAQVLEQVLDAVVARQAERLLIDVTSVAVVDTQLLAQLTKIVHAAALLGVRSGIIGTSAAMARAPAELELDMQGLTIYPDLQSALAELSGDHD
jgi:anti-anti-sigma regulatory factor